MDYTPRAFPSGCRELLVPGKSPSYAFSRLLIEWLYHALLPAFIEVRLEIIVYIDCSSPGGA